MAAALQTSRSLEQNRSHQQRWTPDFHWQSCGIPIGNAAGLIGSKLQESHVQNCRIPIGWAGVFPIGNAAGIPSATLRDSIGNAGGAIGNADRAKEWLEESGPRESDPIRGWGC
jgi:hypothetical protein